MAIRIVTDSTCDLTAEHVKELGIDIVPLKVRFEDREYTEGVDITIKDFYKMLAESSTLPSTSQPSPEDFERIIRPHLENGDDVVAITLSEALSGTYQSASIAKKNLRSNRIHVIDSKSATLGLGDLVTKAVALVKKGAAAAHIAETITDYAARLHIIAVIDTLKYLHKGGRLSSLSTALGGVLGIKPIVGVVDGKVEMLGRARGTNGAFEWVCKKYADYKVDKSLGAFFGYSETPERMHALIATCKEKLSLPEYTFGSIGSVIGTHAGPGVAAIGFYEAR